MGTQCILMLLLCWHDFRRGSTSKAKVVGVMDMFLGLTLHAEYCPNILEPRVLMPHSVA